eukprot:4833674-Pyramimonas_sp.AAC.1
MRECAGNPRGHARSPGIMAPTSQSGLRWENDRMGLECPGEFCSGFRRGFRAAILARNADQ